MILKYDQTNYKISDDGLERAIKDIKEGNKYINKLENEIIYYKIKINKAIEYINKNMYKEENCCGLWWYQLGDYETPDELLEILKGSDK